MSLDGLTVEIIGGVAGSIIVGILAIVYRSKYVGKIKDAIGMGYNSDFRSYFTEPSLEEQIPKVKILFVDDEEVGSVDTLKENGYNVFKWDSVADYSKLISGEFDIIVLDINGVALHLSEDDGFGIIKSIKREAPHQIVVAFSAKSYDLSKQEFFQLADAYIFKPSSFIKMKTKLDQIIASRLSVESQIKRLEAIVLDEGNTRDELSAFQDKLCKSLHYKKEINWDDILSFTSNKETKRQLKTITKNLVDKYRA